MTKLEILVTKEKKKEEANGEGAYLATYGEEDDRIVFFDTHVSNTVTVINKLYAGSFNMQENQPANQYTNFKKIKKMTIEVELE